MSYKIKSDLDNHFIVVKAGESGDVCSDWRYCEDGCNQEFSGSIANCEAYIRAKESGYLD